MSTRVAAAAYAGGLNKPATAAKSVVSRRTLAQGVVTPARKSNANASVPIASSPAANVAVTAETTPAHANNTADSARRRRLTVSAAEIAENRTVESAAQGAYKGSPPVIAVRGVKRSKLTATVSPRSTYRQGLPSYQYPPLCPA